MEPADRKTPHPIRFFIAMIRHHWPAMALGGLLSLLATLAAVGLFSLSGWFITATAYAGLNMVTAKAFNFFLPSIGVRLFAMVRTGARYAERLAAHDATFRILETLRTWCYNRLEPLAPARLARHHTGDLLTRIITDIDTLDNLYLRVVSPTVIAAVVVALLVGFIGYFSPAIAGYNAAMFLLAGIGIPIVADRKARKAARQLNVHTATLRAAMVDGIHGLAALMASGAEQKHREKVMGRHQDLVDRQLEMSHATGLSNALMGLVSGLAVVGTLYLGVAAVTANTLSGPQLVLLALAIMAGFDVVLPLSNAYQYLGQTSKAADRLHDVTKTAPAVTFPAQSKETPEDARIDFDHLFFEYAPDAPAVLTDINFTIPSGSRTAVMGATGSGKSTLLYLLSRFDSPTRGHIRLGGCDIDCLSETALRRQICVVDQKAHIFNRTLRDNLGLVNPDADESELKTALSAVRLLAWAEKMPEGLDTWVGEAGRMLSGGQSKRLAIARAVISTAPVWAFDEPTEGLDTDTAVAMMQNLLEHGKERTLIMVTHRPEAIAQMDQVVLMADGRIVEVDAPDRLADRSPLYRKLLNLS